MKQFLFIALAFSFFAFTACNDRNDSNDSKENISTSTDKKENTTTSTDKKETTQLAKDEMYTCTMHRQVMSQKEGTCPVCGMTLTKEKMTAEQEKLMKEGTYKKSKEEQ